MCGSDASTAKLKFTPRREASLSCGQIDGYWGSPFATFRAATRLVLLEQFANVCAGRHVGEFSRNKVAQGLASSQEMLLGLATQRA